MMITVLEARVTKENWPILEEAFQRALQQTPPGLEQSYLVHSIEDAELWQIISIWSGMPSLQQIQKAKEAGGDAARGAHLSRGSCRIHAYCL